MNKSFYIFILLLLASCKNPVKNSQLKKAVIIDTVATTEIPAHKYGTIIKSKPFKINGIECYWEQTDTLVDDGTMDLIKLKNYKTNQILVNHVECCLKYGFDFYSLNNFLDVNFDGYEDFLIRSYGSSAMFEQTNIYLFDNRLKRFVYSDLSDIGIETDSANRKLITSSFDRDFEKTKNHYFDKFGKVKYTEVITEYFSPFEYKIHEKIIKGKVVKRDSIVATE
jgi:hypothetical protein